MKQDYCNCGGNDCGYGLLIYIAFDELLTSEAYYNLIWGVLCNLQLSRRKTREEIEKTLGWNCCITLQNSGGKEIMLPEYDDVFPDDESCRWFGRFLEKDRANINLPKRYYNAQRYHGLYIPALRVMDVAAKLIDPEPFRKFGQIC